MRDAASPVEQKGSVLLEALLAVLVFSFGILALVSMQSAAVRSTSDAKYRADASFLANQIIGQMWAVAQSDLASFATGPAAGAAVCAAGRTAAAVSGWVSEVNRMLPGADAGRQQITVAGNTVTVRVCWRDRHTADAFHNYVVTAEIFK